jgi:Holliday junction resolvase RusA-like endonuclease
VLAVGHKSSIRGDWENYAKACADALNGVAFNDDAQIVDGRTVKRRARKGEQCGAYIVIEPAQEVQSALFGESDLWEKTA